MSIDKLRLLSCKTAVVAVLAFELPLAASAKTNYVNNGMADYTGHDGSTPALAYQYLQTALSNASSGDTIIVAPGTYGADQGLGRKGVDKYPEDGSTRGSSRIYVPQDKNLHIKSSGGAAVTHIVGAHDSETTSGFGANAIRCVDVEMDSSCSKQVIFEGFTFRDGATVDAQRFAGVAGAVFSSNTLYEPRQGSFAYGTYLIDCILSNCIGAYQSQLTVGCTMIRCRIQDNSFPKPNSGSILIDGYGRLINCLVTRNRTVDPTTGETASTTAYWNNQTRFLNCSFVDNHMNIWCSAPCHFYNSIDALSKKNSGDGSSVGNGGSRTNDFSDSVSLRYMIAPSLGDYRLRTGCGAATGGDPSCYTNTTFVKPPTAFAIDLYKDIDGTPIPTTGVIAVGCSQATVTPAAGAVLGSDKEVEFNEHALPQYSAAWAWPTAYPTNYLVRVRPAAGARVFSFLMDSTVIIFPTDYANDTLTFRPDPSTAVAVTLGYTRATPSDSNCKLIYADANTVEADVSQTGATNHPYRTLQQAINAISNDKQGVIVARAGDYDDGSGTLAYNGYPVTTRANMNCRHTRLVAEEGPAATSIVGAPDPANLPANGGDGCGANAISLVGVRLANVAIQGFTLQGAYSGVGTYSDQGVVFSASPYQAHITDSIISGNVGRVTALGVAYYARCRITGNTGASGLFAGNAILISSIVDNNTITSSGGIYLYAASAGQVSQVLGTTLVGDGSHKIFANLSPSATRLNSIFAGGGAVAGTTPQEIFAGCVLSGFASSPWTSGVTYAADPMLLAASGADANFRVFTGSAAVGAATSSVDVLTGVLRQYAELDYNGRPRRSAVSGAFGSACTEGVYIQGGEGVAVVSGGTIGYNSALAEGTVVTLGYAAGSSRPVAGYVVDGVTNLIASATDVVSVTAHAGEAHWTVPIYSNDWCVDDVNGSDTTGLGYNPATAFKTIPAALTNSAIRSGDRVLVEPGTYDEGTMTYGANVIKSRAVVPAGITLESVCGAAETFIKGEASDVMDQFASGSSEYNTGLGRNAIRCVYLPDGAVLKGFTLTNGFTRACNDEGNARHGEFDYSGGGVYGYGRVENCVITGCKAYRGGGGYYPTFVNCVFDGNASIYSGGGTSDAKQFGCLFRNNVEHSNNKADGPFWWYALENCTILDSAGGPQAAKYLFKNDLILGPIGISGDKNSMGPSNFVHCAIASDVGGYQMNESYFKNMIPAGVGNILTNSALLAVDASGRPVVGSSLAVDAGDATANSSYIGDTELTGTQRVYNGTMDIGALEGDWRPTYAKDLKRSAVTVTEATPGVLETSGHTLRLSDGDSLSATLAFGNSTEKYDQEVKVTDGSLTVVIDGESTVYYSDTVIRFENAATVTYSYSGAGSAQLCRFQGKGGFMVIYR